MTQIQFCVTQINVLSTNIFHNQLPFHLNCSLSFRLNFVCSVSRLSFLTLLSFGFNCVNFSLGVYGLRIQGFFNYSYFPWFLIVIITIINSKQQNFFSLSEFN